MTHSPSTDAKLRIVSAEFAAAAARAEDVPAPTGIEIAFAGRSNVGKSSLLNSLLWRKNLVRTSSTPGSTRKLAFFRARAADGVVLELVDLPGYGYAKCSKSERLAWGQLIESYLLERPGLSAVVILLDIRRGIEQDDRDLFTLVASAPRAPRAPPQAIVVATKLDKLSSSQQSAALRNLRRDLGHDVLGYSAETHAGRIELWQAIRRATGVGS